MEIINKLSTLTEKLNAWCIAREEKTQKHKNIYIKKKDIDEIKDVYNNFIELNGSIQLLIDFCNQKENEISFEKGKNEIFKEIIGLCYNDYTQQGRKDAVEYIESKISHINI